jgi:hypothetical protein
MATIVSEARQKNELEQGSSEVELGEEFQDAYPGGPLLRLTFFGLLCLYRKDSFRLDSMLVQLVQLSLLRMLVDGTFLDESRQIAIDER